jgi:hypothetical protein
MAMPNPKNKALTGVATMDMGLQEQATAQVNEQDRERKKKGIQPDALSSSGMMMLLGNTSGTI